MPEDFPLRSNEPQIYETTFSNGVSARICFRPQDLLDLGIAAIQAVFSPRELSKEERRNPKIVEEYRAFKAVAMKDSSDKFGAILVDGHIDHNGMIKARLFIPDEPMREMGEFTPEGFARLYAEIRAVVEGARLDAKANG